MDIITGLQNKRDMEAYQFLLQLEVKSAQSNELYECFDDFVELLKSEKSFVRVRGLRLACAQVQWDIENKIEKNLSTLLCMLNDEKPTAVRQCLESLHIVVLYKPETIEEIEDKLNEMDLSKYKDSMRPLIQKDIEELRKVML